MIQETSDYSMIKVDKRQRTSEAAVDDLVESISSVGQIHPIVVDDSMYLLAGFRRLKACQVLGIPVKYIKYGELSSIEREEVELEENLRRVNLTWQEEVAAKAKLHELKQQAYGAKPQGSAAVGGWSASDTAQILGEDKSEVSRDLALARAIQSNPILRLMPTKSKALSALKELEFRAGLRAQAGGSAPSDSMVIHGDSIDVLKTLDSGSFHIVFTDPPFGIDLDKNYKTGAESTPGIEATKYSTLYDTDDSEETYLACMRQVVPEFYRVLVDDSFLYLFLGWQHFTMLKILCESVGFSVWYRPLIWIKPVPGASANPTVWPGSASEACLFARKGQPKLVTCPRDWFMHELVKSADKHHPTEKPLELINAMLKFTARPGMKVLDPFCGSGSTLVAARRLGCEPLGIDLNEDYVNYARSNLGKETI